MRNIDAFPCRGNRYKWLGILTILTLSLGLTSAPPWGAFAQEQQQVQQTQTQTQTPPATQQAAPPAQIPDIVLTPVSLVGPIERAEKDGTALHLTLRDVTKMALASNLDIAIADTRETTLQASLAIARGSYDPTFTGSFGWNDRRSLNTNNYDRSGSLVSLTTSQSWSAGLSQRVPTGGSLSFTLSGGRTDTNNTSALASQNYNSAYSLQFTQPLLRDFRVDSYRYNIKVANLNLKNNDSQFRSQVSNVVQQIQTAYWNLVSQIMAYEAAKSAVVIARTTVEQNQKKVDVGTMAPIEVLSSKSSQASRELSLLSQEDRIQQAENSLKTLISKDVTA